MNQTTVSLPTKLHGVKKQDAKTCAKRVSKKAGYYVAAAALAVFFLFPFFVMICISLLQDSDVYLCVLFSPEHVIDFGNYLSIFTYNSNYLRYLGNTMFVALISAVGIPFMASLCAYGFAKCRFHGREIMFSIVLGTLMIPGVATMLPLFSVYVELGWLNTLYPLFVPALFGGGATNIFLVRQFMRGVPDDMLDAARIDGAGVFRLYLQFCLPLCVPVLLFVAYQSFSGAWSNFAAPMLYIGQRSRWVTLALGIYYDYGPPSRSLANAAMAAGTVMTIPCIIMFVIFQRYLIEGVSITGLKG
ncbi:MAG: carbohydrate ABC transporter permease [Clostridia bacterium]|nr:carbohydrate ABC transporter permease [Clostridia bacterium]